MRDTCPECGTPTVHAMGCVYCPACGWQACGASAEEQRPGAGS